MLCLLFGVGTALAATTAGANPPKREIRAAWLTTVWAIDWPQTRGTGDNVASKQKEELRTIIDKMHAANMNTVFFQIRSMSDAMYKSSYEPWSIYLVGTGGGEPTYDPLAYAVEYAHSLGMELHAWVNPYRYATSAENFSTSANSYATLHPEWLMKNGQYESILNPGIPEVRDQIARVIAEVVKNYDIDGVLFDDYFYLNGATKDSQDQAQYDAYNPNNLSRADWRREQVNLMVKQVYETIKGIKPYCRFGISPAGVACTSKAVADKYGVEPCPVSSDWQYNGIYSDPLAWLSSHTIDYISPQIYWAIGSSADYDQICNWWSKVANKFGRHFYSSSSLSALGSLGNQEYVNQVGLNRAYDRNGATGSVFYGLSTGLNSATFMDYMKTNVFSAPALQPAMAWHPATKTYQVSAITLNGTVLKWTAPASNLRYAIYAIPTDSIGKLGVFQSSKYLLGVTYRPSYILPQKQEGYSYAVSVFDRYGNEHAPVVMNQTAQTITAAQLTFPEQNGTPLLPCYFSWQAVDKADSYLFQLSDTESFTNLLYQYETTDVSFYVGNIGFLEGDKTYYWRIRTRALNAADTYSEVRAFTGKDFHIVAPANGEQDVELTPLLRCDSVLIDKAQYTFEVATATTFAANKMALTATTDKPRFQVEEATLTSSTTYYVRATVSYDGLQAISSITSFRTLDLPTEVPTIIKPLTNDTIYGTEVEVCWQQQDAMSFRIELSTSEKFAPLKTSAKVADAYATCYTYEGVEPGTYYLRMKAKGATGYTEPSEVHIFTVKATTDVDNVAQHDFYIADGTLFAVENQMYEVYAIDGRCMAVGLTQVGGTRLPQLPQGVYIIRLADKALRYQAW